MDRERAGRLRPVAWPAALLAAGCVALALLFASSAHAATAPTVTGVSPSGGPEAGGNSVTITGTGFTTVTGASGVKFGATNATSYIVTNDTHIAAVVPAGTGTVDVVVTNTDGSSATTASDHYTYFPAPTVASITPTSGPSAGGTTVTITGTNLSGATAVSFGGLPGTSLTQVSNTELTIVSPAHSAGDVDITVATPGGTSATTAADVFTYVIGPVVSGINPASGPATGGTVVTITGTGFTGATGVTFGGTAATGVTVVNDTKVMATAPAHAAGSVDVVVTTPGGSSPTVAADMFTYTGGPVVTAVSPTGGPVAGGTVVTITGTGFTGATGVTFGGVAGTAMTVTGDTTITVTSPAGTAGTVDVLVTTPSGTSAISTNAKFTYGAAPAITSISPTSGAAGTVVTITGTGFTGATSVTFGGVAGTSLTVTSDTSITVTAPAGTGTVNVVVVGPTGSSAAATFTYNAATISYTLNFRWTLLVWNGPDGINALVALKGQETPDNPATNDVSNRVTAIYRWNGAAQKWEAYFPGSESVPGANDFTVLNKGVAYWIAINGSSAVTWTVAQG